MSTGLLILAQVMISQFVGLSPMSGSALCHHGACLGFSLSLSLSLPLPYSCSFSLKIDKSTLNKQPKPPTLPQLAAPLVPPADSVPMFLYLCLSLALLFSCCFFCPFPSSASIPTLYSLSISWLLPVLPLTLSISFFVIWCVFRTYTTP